MSKIVQRQKENEKMRARYSFFFTLSMFVALKLIATWKRYSFANGAAVWYMLQAFILLVVDYFSLLHNQAASGHQMEKKKKERKTNDERAWKKK